MPNVMAASAQRRKVCLMPTSRVPRSNAAKSETRWNLLGCLKLANRS